jgi:hypothetical protein
MRASQFDSDELGMTRAFANIKAYQQAALQIWGNVSMARVLAYLGADVSL